MRWWKIRLSGAMLDELIKKDWGEEKELAEGGEDSGKTSEVDGVAADRVE